MVPVEELKDTIDFKFSSSQSTAKAPARCHIMHMVRIQIYTCDLILRRVHGLFCSLFAFGNRPQKSRSEIFGKRLLFRQQSRASTELSIAILASAFEPFKLVPVSDALVQDYS